MRIAITLLLVLCINTNLYALESEISSLEVETSSIEAVPYNAIKPKERRIESLDIYSLSKYAKLLQMTHIVTPYLVAKHPNFQNDLKSWEHFIQKAAMVNDLPKELIQAVIEVESGAIASAVSKKGAMGLMQIMPTTALDLGLKDPFDPNENIHAGSRYLALMLKKFDGSLSLALAAYNAGANNVIRYGGIPPFNETENFVNKVLKRYHQLRGH
ncbi:MAG: lytic transglycosylase domain-containing protein [Succinatimonas sp.]|nr:lytic transglycosylase domain-containing protein [Succinatimonas sp.]